MSLWSKLLRLFSGSGRAHADRIAHMDHVLAQLDDTRAIEALIDEKKLFLISLMTAVNGQPDPEHGPAKLVLEGLFITPAEPVDLDAVVMLRAASDVIAYLTATLAAERGESVEVTWQREATNLTRIISERTGP